ncbi:MAG: transcription antitermination factor NusB [Gammaproteobacteria bacterium]
MAASGRRGARRMLLQALYQWQVSGHDLPELQAQFASRPGFEAIDADYFNEQLQRVIQEVERLDANIGQAADRPVVQLDPVEHAVLWIGLSELNWRADVPRGVTINEAVELAKAFGGSDSHRYINAILDTATPIE